MKKRRKKGKNGQKKIEESRKKSRATEILRELTSRKKPTGRECASESERERERRSVCVRRCMP